MTDAGRRATFAKAAFVCSGLMGLWGIGVGALFGVALSSEDPWRVFLGIAGPLAALWSAYCYGAYRALHRAGPGAAILVWSFVLVNLPLFPVGTAVAALVAWLRRTTPADAAVSGGSGATG